MQIFARTAVGSTIVVQTTSDSQVEDVRKKIARVSGVPSCEQRILFAGRQLKERSTIGESGVTDGATVHVLLRLRGGAAAKAKLEAEMKAQREAMEKEYSAWYGKADLTEETGVMRVLCVSLALSSDKEAVHGPEDDWSKRHNTDSDFHASVASPYASEPDVETYDEEWGTGFAHQERWNAKLAEIFHNFLVHWKVMKQGKKEEAEGAGVYKYDGEKDVQLENATGDNGLWYKGPVKITDMESGDVMWDYVKEVTDAKMWNEKLGCLKDPWRIGGQWAELERWMFQGLGTTTYVPNYKNNLVLWSQQDEEGPMALTDREKLRLRQAMQIAAKEAKNKPLLYEETQLQHEIVLLVEEGPCHDPSVGIFQWRIKSLKKLLNNKCVFWTNTEDKLPGGSVCDKQTSESNPTGEGNEIIEFWKYEQKIGILRKKHIMEDRQRLLDTIEQFTPTYKAVIKRAGRPADDESGDHYMIEDYQKKVTNIVALALDTHMPDYDEDKIACFIKTLVERRIGPTWHVLVGRSFGFAVQCEARHFLHLYMQHLAVVIWKSEPDPNSGKKKVAMIEGA